MPPKARKVLAQNQSGSTATKMAISVRESNTARLESMAKSQPHLKHLDETIPIFKEVLPIKLRDKNLTIDSGHQLLAWQPDHDRGHHGLLTCADDKGVAIQVRAYEKRIPLIDPYSWMKDKERPFEPFLWNHQSADLMAPENQAYVDCVASSLVTKLKGVHKSPHFCNFYGTYRAVVDIHHYNLEDDLEDFRFTKWFWKGLEAGDFGLRMIEKATGRRLTLDEIKENMKPDEEYLSDENHDSDSDSDSETKSKSKSKSKAKTKSEETDSIGAEELPELFLAPSNSSDLNALNALDAVPLEEADLPEFDESESVGKSSIVSFQDEYTIHAELYNMPVVVMYLEEFEGVLDDFIEMKLHAPVNTKEEEAKWLAWLFQVCATCSQLQNTLRLTHNDLHTANILWRKTTQEFLFYKDSSGRCWKVPTYGYVFSIIDYGRAIFYLNNFCIISSDYNDGHDAAGMYNFGPIEDPGYPRVLPNKSFDLSRLSCGILRGVFPVNPEPSKTGKVITKEGTWEVKETAMPLFNMLWTWLKTKKGECVTEFESGEEKYPGFELYEKIASDVGDAIPEQQFGKPWFQPFLLKSVGEQTCIHIPL
jgi:hypothetical protein